MASFVSATTANCSNLHTVGRGAMGLFVEVIMVTKAELGVLTTLESSSVLSHVRQRTVSRVTIESVSF